MSDFGQLVAYIQAIEEETPAASLAKFEAIRPAVLGMTKRQKEEAEKLAAMSPEERAKAEAQAQQQAAQAGPATTTRVAGADDKRK